MKIDWDKVDEYGFAILVSAIFMGVAVMIAFMVHGSSISDKFLADHHCKLIGQEPDQVVPVYVPGSSGTMTFTTQVVPGLYRYQCDDGYYSK